MERTGAHQAVDRADHAAAAAIEDVRVDHRRPHVAVTEEFLNRTDIVTVLEQMSREGVGVASRGRERSDGSRRRTLPRFGGSGAGCESPLEHGSEAADHRPAGPGTAQRRALLARGQAPGRSSRAPPYEGRTVR